MAPILVLFNYNKEAVLETDTSNYIVRVVLTQKDNKGKNRVIAYYLRKIIGLELNYNIYNKELLAIVEVLTI